MCNMGHIFCLDNTEHPALANTVIQVCICYDSAWVLTAETWQRLGWLELMMQTSFKFPQKDDKTLAP